MNLEAGRSKFLDFNNYMSSSTQTALANLESLLSESLDDAAYVEASVLFSEAVKGASDEEEGRACAVMTMVCEHVNDVSEMKAYCRRGIAAYKRVGNTGSVDLVYLRNNLAFTFSEEGNYDQAERYMLEALEGCKEVFGAEDLQTAEIYNNLGTLYFKAGNLKESLEMHRLSLQVRSGAAGCPRASVGESHGNIAISMIRLGQIEEGLVHFDECLTALEEELPTTQVDYEISASNYRDVIESMGNMEGVAQLEARVQGFGAALMD